MGPQLLPAVQKLSTHLRFVQPAIMCAEVSIEGCAQVRAAAAARSNSKTMQVQALAAGKRQARKQHIPIPINFRA
jgi:hypothetical protein